MYIHRVINTLRRSFINVQCKSDGMMLHICRDVNSFSVYRGWFTPPPPAKYKIRKCECVRFCFAVLHGAVHEHSSKHKCPGGVSTPLDA